MAVSMSGTCGDTGDVFDRDPLDPNEIRIGEGGIWEFAEWRIQLMNHQTSGNDRCRHCIPLKRGDAGWRGPEESGRDPDRWRESDENGQFLVPRVVVGTNEGGYNSAGICLDCILAVAKRLDAGEIEPPCVI
jgi:hypothetical protein